MKYKHYAILQTILFAVGSVYATAEYLIKDQFPIGIGFVATWFGILAILNYLLSIIEKLSNK